MPQPQWTDFLKCASCGKKFSLEPDQHPVSLPCSHTVCKRCVASICKWGCRYDPNCLSSNPQEWKTQLPVNFAVLKVIACQANELPSIYQRMRQVDDAVSTTSEDKKPKRLKDIKTDCDWYCTNYQETSDNDLLSSLHVESVTEDSHEVDSSIPYGLLRPIDDSGQRSTNPSSSSSGTPDSISSDSARRHSSSSYLTPEDSSHETTEVPMAPVVAENRSTFTRLFRRHSPRRQMTAGSICGYSMERDFCVDPTTDRLFKEFLTPNTPKGDSRPQFPAHNLPRNKATQLRRQLFRKQYSDSAAVYYGQQMRRWRMKKQRSDSVNCPVDRGVLRRQERIHEEYFPDEIEEAT